MVIVGGPFYTIVDAYDWIDKYGWIWPEASVWTPDSKAPFYVRISLGDGLRDSH